MYDSCAFMRGGRDWCVEQARMPALPPNIYVKLVGLGMKED